MSCAFNIQRDLLILRDDVKLIGKVGEGNYGEVWKATWRKVTVAVKKLLVQNATPEAIQMLEREITTAARLRHPHVVQVYGACVFSPTEIWLVMEYADGGSLFSKIADKSKAISWGTRMRWAREAATAVAFLHSSKLLHRDIKSPNFLLVKNEIKITDFGMSTAAGIASTNSSKRAQQVRENAAGSVRWMAPETTAASPAFSEKSDVFGLGMVFWELASREIPFSQVLQEAQVVVLIKYEKARPDIPADCPKALADIIAQCWDDSPKKRPTAEEILVLLESEDGISEALHKSMTLSPFATKPPIKRYFDINRGELLAVVPKDRIKVLSTPPPFPQKGASSSFPLPPSVEIVTLLPPPHGVQESKHMLVSERYDERLFSRVAEYFHRFYVPRDSRTKVNLEKVEVIFNAALEEQFRKEDAMLEAQCKGFAEFSDPSLSADQQRYLSHLSTSQNLVPGFHANPISAWHGTQQKALDSICWYGLLNLSKNDPGYYGKGIYFTQEPNYGEFYSELMRVKANGKFSLLLCWVLIGRPHPVTQVQIGSPIKPGYNSHFSLVKIKDATESMCASPLDFKHIDGLISYFPVTGNEEVEGDELIVAKSAQVLPRFIVHYSLSPAKPSSNSPTPTQVPIQTPTPLPTNQIPAQFFPAQNANFKKEFKKAYTTPEFTAAKDPQSFAPAGFKPFDPSQLRPTTPPSQSPSPTPSSQSSSPVPPSSSPTPLAQPASSQFTPVDIPSTPSTPPPKSPISVGAFSLYKKFYEKYKNNKLINGDKQLVLLTPPGEDVKVWITINTINQFNTMNLIHHLVADFCTEASCPQMTAGPKVSYFWAQDKHDKPVSLPAPKYIKNLQAWILAHLENPKVFPGTLGGAFGSSFTSTVKKIWSRMFRIYAHVYHSHWAKLTTRGQDEFLFSLKYLYQFSQEFKLLDVNDLEPMREVLEKWK